MGHSTKTVGLVGVVAGGVMLAASTVAGIAVAEEPAAPTGPCTTVAHIGDSTSIGNNDPAFIPDPAEQMTAQYKAIGGVTNVIDDSAGGRAVIEQVATATPGLEAVKTASTATPAPDCYVVALGTNDAANVAVGSNVDAAGRIAQILELTGDKPVIWPTVKTTEAGASVNGYAPQNMVVFNTALTEAAATHPTLKVLDWAAQAGDEMFAPDGIHYTVEGTKARIVAFANAIKGLDSAAAPSTSTSPAAPTTSAPPATSGTKMPGYDVENWPT